MLMCNALRCPSFRADVQIWDTLDAWGQSSKSDRSTGTIPPRRLTFPPLSLSIPVHLRISWSRLIRASVSIRAPASRLNPGSTCHSKAIDDDNFAAPFPTVSRGSPPQLPTPPFPLSADSIPAEFVIRVAGGGNRDKA